MAIELLLNTVTEITLGPFVDKTDGVTPEVSISAPTAARIWKNGVTSTINLSTGRTPAWTHDGDGYYSFGTIATDVDTLGRLKIEVTDAAVHLPVWENYDVDDTLSVTAGAAPASSVLTISYLELLEEVGDHLGIGRSAGSWSATESTRVNSIIQSGLRQVYYAWDVRRNASYQWSWMRPEATIITTAAYDTGTIEIASGVVTLTAGTFPASWSAEGEVHVSGSIYSVDTYDGATQVTLDDLTVTVAAGATYSLVRPSYDLPEGFDGSFDGDLHYKTGDNTLWSPIRFIAPTVLRTKKQVYNGADRPLFAAIQPKTHDATVGQRWQITFFPVPNAVWTFYGRYKIRPLNLDGTNLYPLGGSAMAEVFLESCLAVAEKRWVEDTKIHQEEFQRLLLQAIDHDADVFSADFLGYNSDESEMRGTGDRRYVTAIHSYEGTVYYD